MNLWKEAHGVFRVRPKAGGIKHMKLMGFFSAVLGRDQLTKSGRP